jgi:hypothetical protein
VVLAPLRVALAVVTGVIVAILLSYAVLIVFVLTTVGIPLGAEPRPLSTGGSAILLLAAAAAAAAGAHTATRIAREHRRGAVWAVGVILTLMMVWGFSGRNSWPEGWRFAVATAMAAGCILNAAVRRRQPLNESAKRRSPPLH